VLFRSGTVSFGLVIVPVGLYSAIEEKQVRFHQMTKSGHRIRQKRVDETTGKEVDYDALVKGYERSKGKVVLVEPEELEAAAPDQTRTIDIEDFVELADIDPIYYNSSYYVAPRSGEGADKAYALLRARCKRAGGPRSAASSCGRSSISLSSARWTTSSCWRRCTSPTRSVTARI